MSFYKEISHFVEYVHSIRRLKNYLSFDLQFPSKWSLPKTMVEENQIVPFTAEDSNYKGMSFVAELNEVSINNTITKVLKIIKLNKEREIKEKLFKQTIEKLKETFEKTDLEKLNKLYFDFEIEETDLTIEDEPESGESIELAEQ